MITLIQRKDVFDQLCEAVDAARISAADSPAWLSRIGDAWDWLIQQESYEIRDLGTDHAAVRIPSATHAHVTYEANGKCQCPAYTTRTPCWHRAASKLLRNALALAVQTPEDAEIAAYWRSYDAQRAAADPEYAAWVNASAGKTAQQEVDELFPA